MKKAIMTVTVLLVVGSAMVSCKKDYKCECTKTYTTSTGSTTKDYSNYTYKDTRNKAESRCNDNESQGTDLGGNYVVNCDIK